jgi:glycosyltransferase involved in cell wall biosynthesis
MQQPLVSIITPTYNHSNYIIGCIKSIQAQSYTNWEVLVMNDGSIDNTGDLVNEHIKQSGDTRIRLFNQNHVGILQLAETYNFALKQSAGEYIGLLDGDDLWEPTKLERQIKIMEEQPKVIMSWGEVRHVSHDLLSIYKVTPEKNSTLSSYYNNIPIGIISNLLVFENPIGALTMLIKKSVLLEIGGFQQGFNLPLIDLPTIMALSLKGSFYFDPFPYGTWRVFQNQTTRRFPIEITKGRYELTLDYINKAKKCVSNCWETDENEVHRYFNKLIIPSYARSGRYALMRKDFEKARTDYKTALFYKGSTEFIWRLRSLVGYIFSYLHLDIEWLAKMLGKKAYK